MDKIIPENEFTEVEGRVYVNPQTGVDTTNAFIENLRQTQQANTQQIVQDTANLGTEVPSNLGGLTGGEGYWTSRYQVPQTNAAVQNLRTAAQAQALNDVLANEQAIWKKRYQDTYRDYQKRQNAKANTQPATPTTTPNPLEIDTNDNSGAESVGISQYTNGEYQQGKLYPVTDYVSDYQDASGQWWQVTNPDFRDLINSPAKDLLNKNRSNEEIVTRNGVSYMYLNNVPNKDPAWYKVIKSAGPGTYSAYAGR